MLYLWLIVFASGLPGEAARRPASRAYIALEERRLDDAIAAFRQALALDPANLHWHKDLAYALLRTGDREQARDQFAAVCKLDPVDEHSALEYAFLAFETRQPLEARRAFDRLRSARDPAIRAAAAKAFDDIDRRLAEAMERWQAAIANAPGQWSAHEELARLAEQRDQYPLASEHFEEAWRLRPDRKELLLDLARIWRGQGLETKARAALVAASRSGFPRVAETARECLGGQIPAPSELALAPPEALPGIAPDNPVVSPREMGERSLEKSYLNDALKYFTLALQQNPQDFDAQLKLGITNNLLRRDQDALKLFASARRSPDPAVRRDAQIAYSNLRRATRSFHLTAWALPLVSSRWQDAFLYGQVRGDFRLRRLPITPYLSMRFVGDSRGPTGLSPILGAGPSYLSETSVILGGGINVRLRRNLFLWAEAGESVSYLGRRHDTGFAMPDYRGGLSWVKGWGRLLGSSEKGWFAETGADAVFVSRFQNNVLLYTQSRAGYTLAPAGNFLQAQFFFAANFTTGRNRVWWGNFAEFGPGLRFRFEGLPPGLHFRAEFLRGVYMVNFYNPGHPNYWDFRLGLWYAFTR